jgi:hypothetical protein
VEYFMKRARQKFNNVFNKRKPKNIKKRSGKKRKLIASVALAAGLFFGGLKTGSAKIQNHKPVTALDHERLISNEEFYLLDRDDQQVILVKADGKDTSGSFFAEGLTPPLPRRPSSTGSQTATEMNGQNTGQGGGNSNPGSGSQAGSCSSNPIPKATPEVTNYGLGFTPKTKKQKALEKMERELKESIEEENKLNAQRQKERKGNITLMIKNGTRLFAPNDKLRDKFHHAPNLDSPIPETLGDAELARLTNPSQYRERLKTFRNKEILPESYVEQYGRDLRLHVLDPNTKIIEGTLGANMGTNGGPPKIEGYHLYNDNTEFDAFFDKNGRRSRTGFKPNAGQRDDIDLNGNMM